MRVAVPPALILPAILLLGACAALPIPGNRAPAIDDVNVVVRDADDTTIRPEARPGSPLSAIRPAPAAGLGRGGQSADALDRTSAAERAAATVAPAARTQLLGETLANLGAPAETGFWLRTGLVTQPRQGRVEGPGGQSVRVELRPSGGPAGSGSQLSLAAFRALDVPLTQLVSLRVFAE
jgi:hypothetical protein